MPFDPGEWVRLEHDGTPIHVRPASGDWFVPDDAGDAVLRRLAAGEPPGDGEAVGRFLERLPADPAAPYAGRAAALELERLAELWLHVTDRCDLACRHCLFSCRPGEAAELPLARALALAREASELGARVFALTGGEPLIHPDFEALVDGLLALPEAHVAVLTNGLTLADHEAALARWPRERVHWQVSVEGLQATHDAIRGRGRFAQVLAAVEVLGARRWPWTLTAVAAADTAGELPALVELAAAHGASNVHAMWHLARGRGEAQARASEDALYEALVAADARARELGIGIDNLDALRSQVFAPTGTVHDGTNAGWESLAVAPDGRVYPTPAMVGLEAMATPLDGGLERAWREGAALRAVRHTTAAGTARPLRFLTGGGDPDHSLIHGGTLVGGDPTLPLIERLALWTIAREAAAEPAGGDGPRLRLKRGDVLHSCGAHGAVALTHSNCLLSVAGGDAVTAVREFYRAAAESPDTDILNPVALPGPLVEHIPEASRLRSYGCGSPVLDAGLTGGEVLLDLGSGTGVECLVAAPLVGPEGLVIGVDMLEPMLDRARRGADAVEARLGYRNVTFRHGMLEQLPVEDDSVDVVISNCVINLSAHKRRTFREVLRVLRPGGRLVVADVVCEAEPPPAIRNDELLHGQCIAGALTQRDLFGLLYETGFVWARPLRRFPYREVGGHPFFSLTFEARKPRQPGEALRRYPGPFVTGDPADEQAACCCTPDAPGAACCQPAPAATAAPVAACGCEPAPAPAPDRPALTPALPPAVAFEAGCIVCGAELNYHATPRRATCAYCGDEARAEVTCRDGHFVCDRCHSADALRVVEHLCERSERTDMVALLAEVRAHPAVHVHGPEHHALVPAVMVATYRNLGGELPPDAMRRAVDRGAQVPGGFCAFAGSCGAATGVSIGFSILLGATPLTPAQRQQVLRINSRVTAALAEFEAARCCQRDSFVALGVAAELSRELLPIPLRAEAELVCTQVAANAECIDVDCPLYP